jgi:dipeptidyl aminopeptidase/acylaminoacyl peptidase
MRRPPFFPRAAFCAALAFLALPGAPAHAAGEAPRAPTAREWLSLEQVSSPQLSPDGTRVAYQVTRADWDADRTRTRIAIQRTNAPAAARVFAGDPAGYAVRPRWSPDGARLAFLWRRDGPAQIYVARADGSQPRALTRERGGAGEFEWSHDGRRIAFTSPAAPSTANAGRPHGDVTLVRDRPFAANRLLVTAAADAGADAGSGAAGPAVVLDGAANLAVASVAWSPDDRRLAIAATPAGEDDPFRSNVYVVDATPPAVPVRVGSAHAVFGPVWSPDGRSIAFTASNDVLGQEFSPAANQQIVVQPLGGAPPRVPTRELAQEAQLADWNAAGIWLQQQDGARRALLRLDPATGTIVRVSDRGDGAYDEFSLDAAGASVAYTCANGTGIREICVSRTARFAGRALTAENAQLRAFRHSVRSLVRWRSADGTAVEGVLIRAADADPNARLPLFVVVHGGPRQAAEPFIGNDTPYPVEMLVAKGALVLEPNYRGSDGYGERFRRALERNLGRPEYEDIITGVDVLIASGRADPGRVAIMGYSHGGYLAAFAATYGDRFRAASAGGLVSDWKTAYTQSPGNRWWALYMFHATPWQDPAVYAESAPLTYAQRARTPLLIQQAALDDLAPRAGANELHRALRDAGVPAEMVVYEGATHAGFSLRRRLGLLEQNLAWFGHWIWDEPLSGIP